MMKIFGKDEGGVLPMANLTLAVMHCDQYS